MRDTRGGADEGFEADLGVRLTELRHRAGDQAAVDAADHGRVVDGQGVTLGVVFLEDVLEVLVGEVTDAVG